MTDDTAIPLPARSALLGVLSGGRSMTPLAALALGHDRASLRGAWQDWPVLGSPAGRAALVLAALGELVVDKLPFTPSRTKPPALLGRITTGAVAGAAIGTLAGSDGWRRGAVLGAAGALVGTFAGAAFRSAGATTGVPDVVFALLEDVVVVGGSAAVVGDD
ncbi:DUF4126 family protein [Amnibacterium sp.]|uniref:DUF4126 family protein n=1 Tax=Amnibacterium sp. TaxID=1872496 RepID=UPI003F7CBA54